MKLRQKKKNYKKNYGVNPVKDLHGKYMFDYPPILAKYIVATEKLGKNLGKFFEECLKRTKK